MTDPVIEAFGRRVTLTHWSGLTDDGVRITSTPKDSDLAFISQERLAELEDTEFKYSELEA